MRKSFTLLFSTLVLLCAFGFSSLAQVSVDVLSPADGDLNVAPTTTEFVVTFNQDVAFTPDGGTLWIRRGNNVVKTIALEAGSPNASISGEKLTVVPGLTFTEDENYSIGISSNAIVNFGGIDETAGNQWKFSIGDYTAPVVENTVPKDDAANVDVDADNFALQVVFDDAVDAVTGKRVWLYRADGTIVDIITLTKSDTYNTTVTIDINPTLRSELTNYYVNIEKGAFVNENKVEFAGIMDNTTWTFTSRDYTAPFVVGDIVVDADYDAATLEVTISEPGSVWYKQTTDEPTTPVSTTDGYTNVDAGDDNVATITLDGLTEDTKYTVYVVAQNADGDQQTKATKVEFTTLDNIAPTADIDSRDTVVIDNVTVGLELTFNEKVQPGTGDLLVKDAGNGTVRTVPASELTFVEGETDGTWVMVASFEGLTDELSEKEFFVIIPDGYVKDMSDNAYDSDFTGVDSWTFVSSDHTAPEVTVTVDDDVPAADNDILVNFSDDVQLINGLDMPVDGDEGDWFDYIALEQNNNVVPFTANYADSTITITPGESLQANTTYVVKIRGNVFEDDNGNAFSAVHTSYEVTTKNFSDATIALLPDGSATVAEGFKPTITFSKEPYIDGDAPVAVTVEDVKALITLKETDSSGDDVAFDIEWDAATYTVTVVPTEALSSEGVYYFDFNAATVVDVNGVKFDDPSAVTFTMVDYIAPTVKYSHSGTVEDKAPADPLTLQFSETVTISGTLKNNIIFRQNGLNGEPLDFTVNWDATYDTLLVIQPAMQLEEDSVYFYGIGAGVASDGVNTNETDFFSTFTYSPAETVPGGVLVADGGYNPAIGATDVKVNSTDQLVAKLTFSEAVKVNPVMPDDNDAVLYLVGTDTDTEVARVSISGLDVQGSVLTLTFADTDATAPLLVSEGKYYITVDKDVIVANDNNTKTFAGVDAEKWSFTAADIDLPVLTAVSPKGDDLAELNEDLVISSDDAVSAGTGNITIAAGDDGDVDVKTIAVSEEMIDGKTITVSHEGLTQYNTEYTVTVPADAFEDEGGNGNEELTWTFTTVANTAPTFVLEPAHNDDLVDVTTTEFTITFSEEMQKGPNGKRAYLYQVVGDVDGSGNTETNDVELGYVYVEQGGVTLDSNVVTLDFNAALAADNDYYIVVEQGMFEDVAEPESQVAVFAGITAGKWMFYTYDKTAPTWTVDYVKLGGGMDINSDIIITFSKPVDDNGTAITSAQLANLITLEVGSTNIVFSGTINEDKTVVVLDNSSFVPALSTIDNYSNMAVTVTIDGTIQGVDNDLPVETVTKTFNIADYTAPSITSVTEGTVGGDQFEFVVTANEDGTIYWLVKEGAAETVTAAEVMAGDTIENYTADEDETVTVTGVESETQYTVYAVAVDANDNVSTVNSSLSVTTIDITAPVIAGELPSVFEVDNAGLGTLLLVFSEEVELPADGATAVIRKADTYQLVGEVGLAEGTNVDELVINFDVTSFDDSQEFVIEIAEGLVADTTGNTWAGQMGLGDDAWVVGLPDRTPAELISVVPDIATDTLIALDEVFTLTFNEEVKLTDNFTIEIKYVDASDSDTDNWELFELIEASGVTVDSNVVTIDFEREFDYSTDYLLTVAYWSFEDMAGNGFRYLHKVDELGNDVYRTYFSKVFTTVDEADVTAPVATFSPADGDTIKDVTTPLTITFDEAIVMGDGSAIDEYDLDTLVYFTSGGTDLAHEAAIDATEKIITITPASNLVKGEEYTYGFAAAFADAAENEVAAGEATFVVATDAVDPVYITFDPDNEIDTKATVIPVDQTFRITFNGKLYTYDDLDGSNNNIAILDDHIEGPENVDGGGAVTLTQGDSYVSFSAEIVSWTDDETIIEITPAEVLDSETGYTLSVVANKLQFGVGNAFVLTADRVEANEYVTVDVVDPLAVDYDPKNGKVVGRASTISIVFNELVKAGTGTIEIREAFGEVALTVDASTLEVTDKTVEITDLTELEDGQEYFVLIPEGAITDTTGNAWAGLTQEDEWYFSVSDDLSAPAVTEFAPEGRNIPMETELAITFDRPVNVVTDGNGFIAVYDEEGVAVQLIRASDALFTVNGSEVTIDIDNDLLKPGGKYFVEVAAGTFVSQANDTLFNTAVNRNLWSFTMEINIEPKNPVLTPADDATDVPLNTVASMEFNVEVKAGTGEITLRLGGDGSVVHAFDVTSEEVVFDSTMVYFSLEGLLDIATDYYIIVPEGAITNISEQPKVFAGLEQMSSWNFTTTADAYIDAAIADVQGTEAVSPMVDDMVRIAGTITAVADTGFFVQDANAAWSGVWVEFADLTELAVGDGVTVTGVVAEVDNVTTIVADDVTVGEATLEVEAIVLDAPSAVQDEMYESVLVFVGGAGTSGVDDNGQFEIFYELNDSAMVNNWIYATPADSIIAGNYYDVTGVVNGAQDAYTLEPRMVEDIVDITKLTPAIIVPEETVKFNIYPNPFNEGINIDNHDKLTRIIITNIAGQRVMDVQYPERRINTSNLVSGVYVISLYSEEGMVKSDRIVKR